jgi:glycosyltransferase involved in cell wall biosynthesis
MITPAPLVSVVLPVYNGAAFVEQAVHSILEQTLVDWELLIVDDGSLDDSRQICENLARSESRVRVYANEQNLGLARTMNRLVALSGGKYIAVQEQDDISEPGRLALEAGVLDAQPEVGLVSGVAAWMDGEGKIFNHFPGLLHRGEQYPQDRAGMVRFLYTEQCKVANAACMFRRTLVEAIPGPFDPAARMSIDWQFFLHAAHLQRIHGIPQVLVRMRRGGGHRSLTANKDLQFREARRCIQKIHARYRDRRDSPVKRNYRRAMATQLVLEARSRGGLRGLALLGLAFLYCPPHAGAQQTLRDFCQSARRKMTGHHKFAPCAEG